MRDRHVVALSGGKDSTAMALRLAEVRPQAYLYVCTPTGDEPPEMVAHWIRLGEMLGSRIVPVMRPGGLRGAIAREKSLPNFRRRFCTRMLKIEPFRAFLAQNAPCVSYVGLRADEEGRAGGAYHDIEGVAMRFPLREWGWDEADVRGYLADRGGAIPRRTDCRRCYHQRIAEWFLLWQDERDVFEDAASQERSLGQTFRTPGRDAWPVALADLGAAFGRGRVPKRLARELAPMRDAGGCRVCTL